MTVVGLALALAIVVAGCGTDSGSGASAPAGNAAATSTPPATEPPGSVVPVPNAPTDTVWLCKPGAPDNPCEGAFNTSVVAADGAKTVREASVAKDPPIDCFYVYPTVSRQPGVNADLTIEPAETGVARSQAARFSQQCKVYAPMYRQLTLSAISNRGGLTADSTAMAYGDVEKAWFDYLAHYNHGRGVVLIGHSQGAMQLRALVQRQIDKNADVRKLLVSAVLLGGNVTVPVGQDVGGSFTEVPACRKPDQVGCVVAYSTFLTDPPPNSLFGRTRTAGQEVLCTNPAALGGGAATLDPEFPSGTAAAGSIVPSGPSDTQPWVSYAGLYTGECQNADGASVLHITPMPGPDDTRPVVTESIGPTWGLHLVDVNIDLGNLVDLVGSQARAYKH